MSARVAMKPTGAAPAQVKVPPRRIRFPPIRNGYSKNPKSSVIFYLHFAVSNRNVGTPFGTV